MSTRQLNLHDFAAHCLEEIKTIETGDTVIELLSSGKVVAVLSPPSAMETGGTLEGWLGRGTGLMSYGAGYDPAAPAFEIEEWEAFQESGR